MQKCSSGAPKITSFNPPPWLSEHKTFRSIVGKWPFGLFLNQPLNVERITEIEKFVSRISTTEIFGCDKMLEGLMGQGMEKSW